MPTDIHANNRRIAKNTLLLYLRMSLIMVVQLYTSRVVLNALGIEDYGIYTVVGGLVSMFSILSCSLSSGISRFITFELGKGNEIRLNMIFSSAVTIQGIIGLVIVTLIETAGVWFLNYKMNIAPERIGAANWVLHCTAITFFIGLVSVPYNAEIIAHEKMQAFAYISILEASLKLAVALLLSFATFDKLRTYSVLIVMTTVVVRVVYGMYCSRRFKECRYRLKNADRAFFKELLGYSGWNLIGSGSFILSVHGVNILLNIFFGAAVNAARGIAMQVNTAIRSFTSSFMTAVNPQIIKLYASERYSDMMELVLRASRFSFYLILLCGLPVIFIADPLLNLWLKTVPLHGVAFVRLTVVICILDSLSAPLMTANAATGKIRDYQLVVGGLQMLNFPICWVLFLLGNSSESVYIVSIVLSQVMLAARLLILKRSMSFPIGQFLKKVYEKVILVSLVSVIPIMSLDCCLPHSKYQFCFIAGSTLLWCGCVVYAMGLTKEEKKFVMDKIGLILKNKS